MLEHVFEYDSDMISGPDVAVEDLTATGLLDQVAARRREAMLAEIDVLQLAVAWAHANPELDETTGEPVPVRRVSDEALAAHFVGLDPDDPIHGPAWAGLPPIAWDADAGFATAANLSTTAARSLIRDALILTHRLPATWARLSAGLVPAWRARQIASAVAGAPDDVCAHLDQQVAHRAETLGHVTLSRVIAEAMIRLYPDEVEAASLERLDHMHVTLERHITHTGLVGLNAVGEYADLDDLDHTLTALANRLRQGDDTIPSDAPLDYLRARALGLLADPEHAAQLLAEDQPTHAEETPARRTPARIINLVVHLTPQALTGHDPAACVTHGSVDHALLADLVATWCSRPNTTIRVQPVIDLNTEQTTETYRPTQQIARHVELRDRTCRFPHCTRTATAADKDHVIPHTRGGPTTTSQLIALCRHHHRLKTHAGYQPRHVEPGTIHWTTPHGFEYLVTQDGTRSLTRTRSGARATY